MNAGTHSKSEDRVKVIQEYEHIATQNKDNINIIYLHVAMKSIIGTIGNNTCNFVW